MDVLAVIFFIVFIFLIIMTSGKRRVGQSGRNSETSFQEYSACGSDEYRSRSADMNSADSHFVSELKGRAHVIDGDTIAIKGTKIRLAGIDAPELDQPWGQKSKWELVRICRGSIITAKLNGEMSHDRYVGTCYLPTGEDIGAELIKRGLALDWPLFSGGKYRHLEPPGARRRLMAAKRIRMRQGPKFDS